MILHFRRYCFSLAKVHSIGESLNQRATTGKAHKTPRKRLKHVTNDSRLDLSFIIVSDTCRHRPLFCRLRNNNMLWHVSPGPDFMACIVVGCTTEANRRKTEASRRKVIYHKGMNTYSIFRLPCKHDKLRFNQLWKCIRRSRLTSISTSSGN